MVKGDFLVTCKNSRKQHDFPVAEADFELNSHNIKQMGTEPVRPMCNIQISLLNDLFKFLSILNRVN